MPPLYSILILAGGFVTLVGLALLGRALFADRARGRRRCPRCWYPLSGLTTLTCPECGHAAADERALLRTRRGWRMALVSMLITAGGAVALGRGALIHPRPFGSIPTALLIGIESAELSGDLGHAIDIELTRRLREPESTDGELRAILSRARSCVFPRRSWPRDVPVRLPPHILTMHPGILIEGIDPPALATPPPPVTETYNSRFVDSGLLLHAPDGRFAVTFKIDGKRTINVDYAIRLVDTIDDVITPISGPEIDAGVRAKYRFTLLNDHEWFLQLNPPSWPTSPDPTPADMTFAFVAEIRRGETVIATTRGWYSAHAWADPSSSSAFRLSSTKAQSAIPNLAAEAENLTLVVRSDAVMALRDRYAGSYWSGSYTVPLTDLLR